MGGVGGKAGTAVVVEVMSSIRLILGKAKRTWQEIACGPGRKRNGGRHPMHGNWRRRKSRLNERKGKEVCPTWLLKELVELFPAYR